MSEKNSPDLVYNLTKFGKCSARYINSLGDIQLWKCGGGDGDGRDGDGDGDN